MAEPAALPHTRCMEAASVYEKHVNAFTGSPDFVRLENGELSRDQYDRFILNVVRTHAKSPHLLAFLFSLAPPTATASIRSNMLEELGVADDHGDSHPALLEQLLHGADLGHSLQEVRSLADMDMRRLVTEPMLYETLVQLGLSAMIEVTAFEYMLSRVADRIAIALATHRALGSHAIEWFTHHGAVDVGHAEQGLCNLVSYIDYYGIDERDAATILEMTTRENVFIKRYFAGVTPTLHAELAR